METNGNQLNIWIINHYAITPHFSGGTRHYEFARYLASQNHRVTLWLCSFLHQKYIFVSKEKRGQIRNSLPENLYLKWIWAPPYKRNDIFRALNMLIFTLLVLFRGLVTPGRPDVIVASSPHLFACLSGWVLARVKGSKFVLEIRDLWPESLVAVGAGVNKLVIGILSRLEVFLYRKSQKIIVVAEGIQATLRERGFPAEKIVLIPNGVNPKDFKVTVSREEMRRKLGLENKFVALYAGSHAYCYALDTVVEAASFLKENPGINVVFLGDGQEKQRLIQKSVNLGLNNVRFLDPVAKSEVPNYLNMADILILTTQNNYVFQRARPNKLFDYLASGRPILCSVEGEMQRVVEESRAGIPVKPGDPRAMAEGIKYMYEHRHLFSRWENNGRAYVYEHCNREKQAAQLERILLSVTGRAQRKASKKPEVLIVSSVHHLDDCRIFYKEALSIASRYSVELHAVDLDRPFFSEDIEIKPLPQYRLRALRLLNCFRLLLTALRSPARVIHFHDPELLPFMVLVKFLAGKKVIYDIHEDLPASISYKEWIPKRLRPLLAKVTDRAEIILAGYVDALIFAEFSYGRRFKDIKCRKAFVVNYALGPEKFKTQPENPIDVDSGAPVIIYAGAMGKARGTFTTIEALGILAGRGCNFHYYLVGPVTEKFKETIQREVRKNGLTGKVTLTGRLPLPAVFKYYKKAALGLALLHPEKNYVISMPTKIYDYMSAGIPMVVSNFPAWKQLVSEHGCGIAADPLDVREIAKAIEYLLLNPETGKSMGERGFSAFKERYNWQSEEKKLIDLYQELMGRG